MCGTQAPWWILINYEDLWVLKHLYTHMELHMLARTQQSCIAFILLRIGIYLMELFSQSSHV